MVYSPRGNYIFSNLLLKSLNLLQISSRKGEDKSITYKRRKASHGEEIISNPLPHLLLDNCRVVEQFFAFTIKMGCLLEKDKSYRRPALLTRERGRLARTIPPNQHRPKFQSRRSSALPSSPCCAIGELTAVEKLKKHSLSLSLGQPLPPFPDKEGRQLTSGLVIKTCVPRGTSITKSSPFCPLFFPLPPHEKPDTGGETLNLEEYPCREARRKLFLLLLLFPIWPPGTYFSRRANRSISPLPAPLVYQQLLSSLLIILKTETCFLFFLSSKPHIHRRGQKGYHPFLPTLT